MAAVTPSSDLYLLKCPIEIDNRNQLNFSNATAQYNYFFGLNKIGQTNFSYQRKDSTIRYPAHIDSIRNYNYCMYRNDNYSNKWFYAFIEGMEYLNDSTTLIKIKTDVYQTWQFNLSFKRSFVVREHVNNDGVGVNTIPEGLEYGEYIVNGKSSTTFSTKDCYLAVQVSDVTNSMSIFLRNTSRVYNGIPQGCWVLCFDIGDYVNFSNFIRAFDKENLANAIVSVGLIPKNLITGQVSTYGTSGSSDSWECKILPSSNGAITLQNYRWDRLNTIDGYTPVNKKLLCSPYNFLRVTNNSGSSVCYAWEDFSDASSAWFTVRGVFSQGCDIKATPTNYKKTDSDGGYDWSISLAKLPMVSWNSNFYLNWAAVNSKYVEVQAGLAAGTWATNMIGGMLSGSVDKMLGGTMSLASNTASLMQQVRQAEMTPNSAKGNQNTGDLNWSLGKTCFTGVKMSIKAEYARCLDEYFSAYGYKVNRIKVPNITGRRNWNYIETKGCNIIGEVPQEDLDEIKQMFDNGVTIWHNSATFMDYSQNNAIV